MTKPLLLAVATLAVLPLAACNNSSSTNAEVVDTRAPDPMASEVANAAPVELPPAISSSVTFRCQPGNKLVYVDFFHGDKQVAVRTDKSGTPKLLKAPAAGEAYTADDGSKLTGDAKSATVKIGDGASLTCKA